MKPVELNAYGGEDGARSHCGAARSTRSRDSEAGGGGTKDPPA